jgi:hypothetical protein
MSYGYTVLTHEAIIDSVSDASLKKLLLKRFPDATPEELEQAHAYTYGGCIIQDMGIIRSAAVFSAISRTTSAAVISSRR